MKNRHIGPGRSRLVLAAIVLFACGPFAAAQTARRSGGPPPAGAKMASGRHFDLYVTKTEADKPMASGYTMHVFQVEAVARTAKHGTQRIRRRVETTNADLLDPKSWEVVDFDQDGWDDYRYVAGLSTGGCRTWDAERWEPTAERFTSAPKFVRSVDAQGKTVPSCIGR